MYKHDGGLMTAPNQYWIDINGALWHTPKGYFLDYARGSHYKNAFEITSEYFCGAYDIYASVNCS